MNFLRRFWKKKAPVQLLAGQVVAIDRDQRIQEAIEKARLTLHYFQKSLRRPHEHQRAFALKVRLSEGPHMEQVWLSEPHFDDMGIAYGRIQGKPTLLSKVHEGSSVGVSPEEITDWMIIEHERLIGGYTIRCFLDDDQILREVEKSLGCVIDEGEDHWPMDLTTPEGAILCLEDAYNRRHLADIMACKDFQEEARILIARMDPRLANHAEVVAKAGEALKAAFLQLLDEQGFPDFSGATRAFPQRQYIREDLVIVTEVCRFGHEVMTQRIHVIRRDGRWKVLNIID